MLQIEGYIKNSKQTNKRFRIPKELHLVLFINLEADSPMNNGEYV